MKTYHLSIKSHTELPDYEKEVEAETIQEALKIFMSELGKWGWEETEVLPRIWCDDDIPF